MSAVRFGTHVRAAAWVIACGWQAPLLFAADDPAPVSSAASATPAPVDRSQEKVCHHEKETGSYIGRKVCRTRAEEELALRVARAMAEQMNSNSAINRGDTSGMAGGGDGDAAQH